MWPHTPESVINIQEMDDYRDTVLAYYNYPCEAAACLADWVCV